MAFCWLMAAAADQYLLIVPFPAGLGPPPPPYPLGWSDFHLRKWTHCCRLAMFLCIQSPKNRQILQRVCVAHARLNFYFQKITETLNMNISCWNLQIQFLPFTSKNHHQTKIGAQFFFNFNKNRRNCFWPGQRKTFFLVSLLF